MREISNRSKNFTDSVIRRMTRISNEYEAINLSQGFPDFDPPKELLRALESVALGDKHQYAVTWGAENYRCALTKKQEYFSGLKLNPNENIVVTCGSTEAMMASMLSLVNEGDKVAVFSPFYENYGADAILSGAEPIYIPLKPPHYDFDPEELESAFKNGAKLLILCNPSNPCGKVFTKEELLIIANIIEKYDAFVITDEVYEHIVFEPNKHIHFAGIQGMFERTLTCSSLSKTYSITGWRLGHVIGPKNLIDVVKKVHDFLTVGAAAPLQEAAVTALNFSQSYYDELISKYTQLRDVFLNGLDRIGLNYTRPQGAYYVMVDISEYGYDDDLLFCEDLIKKVGVAAVPGSSFFKERENRYIRFHFAKKEETLNKALDRLENIGKLKK